MEQEIDDERCLGRLMLALPLASLDRMALQRDVKDIGGR